MLPAHMGVQRIPRLRHRPAEDASIPGADRVLVLQVRPQRVRRSVDLPALRARPGVGRSDSHHIQRSPRDCNTTMRLGLREIRGFSGGWVRRVYLFEEIRGFNLFRNNLFTCSQKYGNLKK